MGDARQRGPASTAHGNHFSCSLTAVLVARVQAFGGTEAVGELLELAESKRTPDYLLDIVNWVSYDEAIALFRAGARVTHHPQFARVVGEDAVRRLSGSPVAALLRSLGSPENVYRQITTTSTKYSVVTTLQTLDVGPGFAEIVAIPADGFPRDADHCRWTWGLLTQPTILFGLPPAIVEHEECAALGAAACRYRVTWVADGAAQASEESEHISALQGQIEAMRERLHSMFETASDLIGTDEIADVLVRITDRAAVEIRAPRYLLAIRTTPDGEVQSHSRGMTDQEAAEYTERVLNEHPAALPESWLVVPVRSSRHDYGRLLALYDEGRRFFAEERALLEVYARYAASALDSATALVEAKRRYGQSSALLELARELAAAGTSGEVAHRLAEAVPMVVDCDRVGVYLWEVARGELVHCADSHPDTDATDETEPWSRAPTPGGPLEKLLNDPSSEPIFVGARVEDHATRDLVPASDAVASIVLPLTIPGQFLGVLAVSVAERPERLEPGPDLLDRLSGIAAQAIIALQNGRLVDQITHQALHDELTGLANRLQFTDQLRGAIHHARTHDGHVTLCYLDLDRFKPVNDEFGHDAGDELLVAVGERLTACTRSADTVARLGGDEFAVLMDARSNPGDAPVVAGRLAQAFVRPFTIAGRELSLAVSIGTATFPDDATDADALLRVADSAMFQTKRGRHHAAQLARQR